jgi:DNA (cytosine-5)-methyltransferase 1
MARIEWGLVHLAWPAIVARAGNTYEAGTYKRAWPATESPLMARQATDTDAICGPVMVNHGHTDDRVYMASDQPLPTRTSKIGDGITFPFITMARRNVRPTPIDEPLDTVATGRHHYLTSPPGSFYVKNYGGNAKPQHLAKPLTDPFGAITTIDHHALVIPYRRTSRAHRITEPLPTVSTHTSAGVLQPRIDPMDCYYRTVKPREHARAQRFYDDYIITGNAGEQTMQAGNAVPCNVAQWVGMKLAEALA